MAVLRTGTRMAGSGQTASDLPNHRAGGMRDKLTSLHPHLSVSLYRAILGLGISVISQIPEKNILALCAWRTCAGDTDYDCQIPSPGWAVALPEQSLSPYCTDKPSHSPERVGSFPRCFHNRVHQPPLRSILEPSLSDL